MKAGMERIRQKFLLWKSEYITELTQKRIKGFIRLLIFVVIIKIMEIIGIFKLFK